MAAHLFFFFCSFVIFLFSGRWVKVTFNLVTTETHIEEGKGGRFLGLLYGCAKQEDVETLSDTWRTLCRLPGQEAAEI